MLYEIINPSDKITCEASSDKIACFCAWSLSGGFGVENEEGESFGIPMFHGGQDLYDKTFGKNLEKFIIENKNEINKCFLSFMYGSFETFKDFKNCLDAITDDKKRQEFLDKHEDNHRTSMNQIVLSAWKMGDNI